MELTDILTLVKAGYTKDEIAQMDAPKPTNPVPAAVQESVPVPAQAEKPVAAPVAEPVAAPQVQPAQTQPDVQPSMADIMQSIAKLTSAVQANAIASSVIPQGLQNPPNAEDMLAEIIRPTFKERA